MRMRKNKKKRGGAYQGDSGAIEVINSESVAKPSYTPLYIACLFAIVNILTIVFQDPPKKVPPSVPPSDPSSDKPSDKPSDPSSDKPSDPSNKPSDPPSKKSQLIGSISGSVFYIGLIFILCHSGHTTWAWFVLLGGAILAIILILLIFVALGSAIV